MLTRSDVLASVYMYCTSEGCWILHSPGSHPSWDSGDGIVVSSSASAGRYSAEGFPNTEELASKLSKIPVRTVNNRTIHSILGFSEECILLDVEALCLIRFGVILPE